MKENLTENNNPLIKDSKSKIDSSETTYNDEKFPKSSSRDSEKIKKMVQMGDTHSQPAKLIYRGVIKL